MFTHKVEFIPLKGGVDICYNMDEPWQHYAKAETRQSQKDKHYMISFI